MTRRCEICGRKLKTGRKYCYEHKQTVQAEGFTTMKKLERAYMKYRIKLPATIFIILAFGSILGGIVLAEIKGILWFFLIAVVGLAIAFGGSELVRSGVRDEIKRRSKKFREFAKEYGAEIKQEKEFRRFVFSQ